MIFKDLRHAAVSLWRTPGFTLAALVVLTVGIAATTATFSVVNGVLMKPLPFPGSDAIVRIWSSRPDRDLPFFSVSLADYADWRARARSFSDIAAYERQQTVTLRGTTELEPLLATRVSPSLFSMLRVSPALGRWLDEEDAQRGSVVVVSHGFWQRRLGGQADVLGQTLVLDDRSWTIVGVMPSQFAIPNAPSDAWLPLDMTMTPGYRDRRFLRVLGRLADGATVGEATTELGGIAAALSDTYPASNWSWGVTVQPLFDTVVDAGFRRSIALLAGAVGCVLLIACANVASLLLTRATLRRREMAIRSAIGASRAALIRLLLCESLVLAAAAGVAGVLLTLWTVDALRTLGAASIPRMDDVTINAEVLAFALVITALTAVLFGLAPALDLSRGADRLRARESAADRHTTRRRDVLVVVEVALAVILLAGSMLMVDSFFRLQQRPLGFDATPLVAAQVVFPPQPTWLDTPPDPTLATARIVSAAAAIPGVVAAAAASSLPFSGSNPGNTFEIDGRPLPGAERPDTDYRVITTDYFRTLDIPLVRGREFLASDGPAAPAVIISASAARKYWPERDPIGSRVRLGPSPWLTIVGIVGDVRYSAIDAPGASLRPMMYLPNEQMPQGAMMIAIKTGRAPDEMVGALRAALRTATPDIVITRVDTMAQVLSQAVGTHRFSAMLMTVFAWMAGVLAAASLYALVAYLVSSRAKEISLRVALGASPSHVLWVTAGRGLGLAAAGLLLGLSSAWASTRMLTGALFETDPADPRTYAAVAVSFLLVTALASCLPARRALRIDPAHALRVE